MLTAVIIIFIYFNIDFVNQTLQKKRQMSFHEKRKGQQDPRSTDKKSIESLNLYD